MSDASPDMFAAVDLGSNSFHLIVGRGQAGAFQVIDRLREMVQLGAGLGPRGELHGDASARALECLRRFGQRLREVPPAHVRALGTNTLRRARNRRAWLREAERALGHPIEIISGREEARLIYLGVTHGLALENRRRLVLDIGGGSTELIIGRDTEPEQLESIAVGCIGITQRFFGKGRLTRRAFKAAETAVALELRSVREAFGPDRWGEAVGSSGTVRAVQRLVAGDADIPGPITPAAVRDLQRTMEAAGHVADLALPGLSDPRRTVLPGGVAILAACLRNLGIAELAVSEYALREGAIHDLLGRAERRDPRDASIAAMAARYQVDEPQADRVAHTALDAFDQVARRWELAPAHRRLLGWAAQIHEVGLAIAHSDHHHHGAYLAENSELPGFSREEQLVLAVLIRGHRGKMTADLMRALPDRLVAPVRSVCVLLRVAVLLHRARSATPLPTLEWTAGHDELTLRCPVSWLGRHPLTRADLRVEQRALRRAKVRLTFA